jgi:hypothetical protein
VSLNVTAPVIGENAFTTLNATLLIPKNSMSSYVSAGYANYFENIVEFDPSCIQGITLYSGHHLG